MFHLTEKQREAGELLGGNQTHTLLAGGSRSGKTFLLTLAVVTRALRAKGSRHGIFRFRFGHCKQTIGLDTLPKVLATVYPQVDYKIDHQDWYCKLPNGSEIWLGGLDEKDRVEKVLGFEFVTIYLNECSQIPYSSRNVALTRLAQLVADQDGKQLPLRMYYDENPPDKGHWTYKLFKLKVDPDSKNPLSDPNNYGFMQLNPRDNKENLSAQYLKTLEELPARLKKRFLEGEFRDAAPDALFTDETFDKWRNADQELPEMLRIVIAVDPSGADDTDNTDNDEIGIVVCGLGLDGNAYVLEDLTCKAGPSVWAKVATDAFDRWQADRIVAEVNFGGAMVKSVIQAARPRTPFRPVTASRGKTVRAEPISAMCETGKVRLAGYFRELEEELNGFTTHGYTGDHSPNRADAMIWGMSDLFPDLAKPEVHPKQIIHAPVRRGDWMHTL